MINPWNTAEELEDCLDQIESELGNPTPSSAGNVTMLSARAAYEAERLVLLHPEVLRLVQPMRAWDEVNHLLDLIEQDAL